MYFHKEELVKSLEGHPMHYLTVTMKNCAKKDDKQPRDDQGKFIGDLIADTKGDVLYPAGSEQAGPILFDKETIFLSSRVHCGETIASFILEGIFEFLTS